MTDSPFAAPAVPGMSARVGGSARRRAEQELQDLKMRLRRADAELEQVREWFAVALSKVADAVITADSEGLVTWMNPAAEAMTGWSPAEALGEPLERAFHAVGVQSASSLKYSRADVTRMGRFVAPTQRSMLVRRDGSKVSIDDTVAPIRDAQGTLVGAVMVFRDVEARRTAAAQREADKRKDEFLATLAHELRNPLAPIDQAALILESATATDEQRRWSSEVIRRQVRNMSVLLDDLLDVARITHGTLMLRAEPTLLSDIVDAAIETARPSIDASRHDLTIDLPNESPVLDVDGLRLAQVLSNLLINAARYTSPGGRLSVSAHCSDDSISVTVSDTGIGFTSRDRTRMFERFSKVDPGRTRSSGGLGIGLALAKGLVELHGGQIDAKSAGPGCGSEFTLRLPASLRRPRIETPSVSQHADRAVRWRVVVADDNVDAATSLAALLEMDGHDVTVVHDGERAVEVVQSARPDVALLDIGMPKLDGYEVAERIRGGELGTQITLVAITGWGQQNDRAHALAAGFDHHFTKPVQHERLRDILQARRPARPR